MVSVVAAVVAVGAVSIVAIGFFPREHFSIYPSVCVDDVGIPDALLVETWERKRTQDGATQPL